MTSRPASAAPAPDSSGATHRVRGSASTRTALKKSVSGTASSAPRAPRVAAQKTSESMVTVTDSPTASPTIFGWMKVWITTLTRL
ncbi:hypothetical protein BJF77_10280 [Kocuria sp. CNJ-770]|nr:hypothetical protein BJF77_10280 [Kocuria sp. CNJ-770]